MSAEDNWQVANCTTPANYFHILRRQLHRKFRKPLILMTPKSLLRHKRVVSRLDEMGPGTTFHRVLWDDAQANPGENIVLKPDDKIRRVVISSGKVYYDLLEARNAGGHDDIYLLRLEQPRLQGLEPGDVGDEALEGGPLAVGARHRPPVDLRGAALYHCGPVAVKSGDAWTMNAAGPTTSIREEPYEADIIAKYGVRAIIGKGGMGAKTLQALKEHGAVYLNAIGGAAQFYARCIERVDGVSLLEFGVPEAMWHLQVTDFPAIVTMDAHGNSLHKDVEEASAKVLAELKR
jgi:tartrate/fumarate subfamily iron-sulfur-dependent hydro-lyase beta chain